MTGVTGNRPPLTVGVDMSDESRAALARALQLARELGRDVLVVHAVGLLEESGFRAPPPLEALVHEARSAAPEAADVTVNVLREDGPASDVLLRVAERTGADLIVVGRRGLGNAPRPLGSVSEAVLASSPVPVVVVPHWR